MLKAVILQIQARHVNFYLRKCKHVLAVIYTQIFKVEVQSTHREERMTHIYLM